MAPSLARANQACQMEVKKQQGARREFSGCGAESVVAGPRRGKCSETCCVSRLTSRKLKHAQTLRKRHASINASILAQKEAFWSCQPAQILCAVVHSKNARAVGGRLGARRKGNRSGILSAVGEDSENLRAIDRAAWLRCGHPRMLAQKSWRRANGHGALHTHPGRRLDAARRVRRFFAAHCGA